MLFDKSVHKRLVRDLNDPNGGVKVITGKPGVGKSTYLSKLHKTLVSKNIISIRHHYFVSVDDLNPQERLNSNRVIEAIKAQIKDYPEELGDLAHKNSSGVPLREFLNELAQSLHKKGRAFVLIIDGLDHVLRYGNKDQLRDFLEEAIYPQPGLWIVIGAQRFAKDKEYLPQIVFDRCPEDHWIDIKEISKDGLKSIVEKNVTGLTLPDHADLRTRIVDKLFELTEGNPLHIRYTLQQLKKKLDEQLLTEFALNDLLPYGGDIEKYYCSLWNIIPPSGKTLAILLSSVDISFEEYQLFDILRRFDQFESDPSAVTEGFNSVVHLLREGPKGLSLYHNSFQLFLKAQDEFHQQSLIVKTKLKDWLEESSEEDLKWAELRKLCYELGNPKPILELDRNWLIDAMCHPREPNLIISQLKLGAGAAFERKLYAKAFELAGLSIHYQNSLEFAEIANEKLWEQAFKRSNISTNKLRLNDYSSRKISVISEVAAQQGHFSVIKSALDIYRTRHSEQQFKDKGEIGAHIPEISNYLTRVAPLDRTITVKRLHSYIKQFSESGWSSDLFEIYVDTLLKTAQFRKINQLLAFDLDSTERQAILDKCAEYDLRSQANHFLNTISKEDTDSLSNFSLLYSTVQNIKPEKLPKLLDYDEFPRFVKEYETGKRNRHAKLFVNNFYLGIIYSLVNEEAQIKSWIEKAEDTWAQQVMSRIFKASINVAKHIKEEKAIDYREIFAPLDAVKKLEFPEDRDLYELQFSLQIALSSILKTSIFLNAFKGQPYEIEEEALKNVISNKFYNEETLLKLLLDINNPVLSGRAYTSFITQEKEKWKSFLNYFPDRAEHYSDLASLLAIHDNKTNQEQLIKEAANNALGYGYHKDMYLDAVIESIEACHKAGSIKTGEWIRRIAPIVENVTEYTDGDETSRFPTELARILVGVDRSLLYKYYYQKASDEALFLAEDIFRYLIRSLDFNSIEEIAIGTTALDKDSFAELESLAPKNQGAKKTLDLICGYFGKIEFPKENSFASISDEKVKNEDYSKVTPEKIEEKLATFENEWDRRNFFVPWANYWLSKDDIDKSNVYKAIKNLVKDDLRKMDDRILDTLYPLAYEFDNEVAFDYLCWAQANGSGWDRYYTDKKYAEERWNFLKKHYPNRYEEFFARSIYLSGVKYGRGRRYFVPIPRGIDFLTLFGDLKSAEEITEASVKFAESLMANLELPPSKWLSLKDIDVIDILFQRLAWPSPLVREWAATAIASLLKESPSKEAIFKRLLQWIKSQQLESMVAVSLLPLVKALEKNRDQVEYLQIDKIIESIPLTSVVIERLVDELSYLLGVDSKTPSKRKIINPVPSPYGTNKFFQKYISGFLAPIYLERAQKVESLTGRSFTRQWSYTADEIIQELGLKEEVGDVMSFMGGHHSPIMIGMSTKLSEVYRSSFLRALQHFYDSGYIPDETYLEYAYSALPIELSYWKVKPCRAPHWWPKLSSIKVKTETRLDLSRAGLKESVDQIIKHKNDYTVLALEGAVKPATGWNEDTLDTLIHLVAFSYKVVGGNIPDAQEVAEIVLAWPIMRLPPSSSRPFNYLESQPDHEAIGLGYTELQDLIIYPLVARSRDLVINIWQWFLEYFGSPLTVYPGISSDLDLVVRDDGWYYLDDEKDITRTCYWLEGLREKHDRDLPIPYGSYLQINSKFLENLLKSHGLRLGYAQKTNYIHKEYSYDEAKAVTDYQLINVSRIII
ncbi:NACHT domain-containing protein [Candidatus Hakubella thermalkaliphila]|uniref:NACHT domain-containing protein n=1 Tax=Candidatus Hakubella thermalkaliphila TaxID=2754717 RepID=UPI001C61138A|nr:ATP-binding protein [Candidatus Hakubella thermalkaliphila]MBT9168192.1 hypothetical protein [Bacillota bacterium]